jgi:hypothetical protein
MPAYPGLRQAGALLVNRGKLGVQTSEFDPGMHSSSSPSPPLTSPPCLPLPHPKVTFDNIHSHLRFISKCSHVRRAGSGFVFHLKLNPLLNMGHDFVAPPRRRSRPPHWTWAKPLRACAVARPEPASCRHRRDSGSRAAGMQPAPRCLHGPAGRGSVQWVAAAPAEHIWCRWFCRRLERKRLGAAAA